MAVSKKAKSLLDKKYFQPITLYTVANECFEEDLCAYEIVMELCKTADVIVCDYSYIFNDSIRNNFLTRTQLEMQDINLIVDEAHNLPDRIKDYASYQLSTFTLNKAIKELKDVSQYDLANDLADLGEVLFDLIDKDEEEYVSRESFIQKVDTITNYEELAEELEEVGSKIKEDKHISFAYSIARFLKDWQENRTGYSRIVSKKRIRQNEHIYLTCKCLDPSVVSSHVIESINSCILMSATLNPTFMYRDLLGFRKENTTEITFNNPFSKKNRIDLIIPKTTTKYSARSEQQYKNMSRYITEFINSIPGNSVIFFPSYMLRDRIYAELILTSKKEIILETKGMNTDQKNVLLEEFKSKKTNGATLLAINGGSFGEGVALPGDLLKGVMIVGMPFSKPDLETKALIDYYDKKFKRGWDFGYLYPAFIKVFQNAGRCIRTEKDKGIIAFLDERYLWPKYQKYFTKDQNLKLSRDITKEVKEFFKK
jgi:DNA excision repair protein ERCC-2